MCSCLLFVNSNRETNYLEKSWDKIWEIMNSNRWGHWTSFGASPGHLTEARHPRHIWRGLWDHYRAGPNHRKTGTTPLSFFQVFLQCSGFWPLLQPSSRPEEESMSTPSHGTRLAWYGQPFLVWSDQGAEFLHLITSSWNIVFLMLQDLSMIACLAMT